MPISTLHREQVITHALRDLQRGMGEYRDRVDTLRALARGFGLKDLEDDLAEFDARLHTTSEDEDVVNSLADIFKRRGLPWQL